MNNEPSGYEGYITNYPQQNLFYRAGWVCPRCGRIHSPDTLTCYICQNAQRYAYWTCVEDNFRKEGESQEEKFGK